jgi:hypothetical protein
MDNKILFRSENYIITHEWEIAYLIRLRDNFKIMIGEFYGDPSCAFIPDNEKYCIIGGNGFIIYYLNEPFISYDNDMKTDQWVEFFREKDNELWIDSIYNGDSVNEVKIIVDPYDKIKGGIYVFDINKKDLKKILPE